MILTALEKGQNSPLMMPVATAHDVCWRFFQMVRSPDGEAPLSAYRATVDIFVEIGNLMFLIAPAPYTGIAVPRAAPKRWGFVYEPMSDRNPGTEPHYLKISKYLFQEVILVRTHYSDDMRNPKVCPWVTDKTYRLSWDQLMSYRHPVECQDDDYCWDEVSVVAIASEESLKESNRRGVPAALVLACSHLRSKMSMLVRSSLAEAQRRSPTTEVSSPQGRSEMGQTAEDGSTLRSSGSDHRVDRLLESGSSSGGCHNGEPELFSEELRSRSAAYARSLASADGPRYCRSTGSYRRHHWGDCSASR